MNQFIEKGGQYLIFLKKITGLVFWHSNKLCINHVFGDVHINAVVHFMFLSQVRQFTFLVTNHSFKFQLSLVSIVIYLSNLLNWQVTWTMPYIKEAFKSCFIYNNISERSAHQRLAFNMRYTYLSLSRNLKDNVDKYFTKRINFDKCVKMLTAACFLKKIPIHYFFCVLNVSIFITGSNKYLRVPFI